MCGHVAPPPVADDVQNLHLRGCYSASLSDWMPPDVLVSSLHLVVFRCVHSIARAPTGYVPSA